jgi:hypothetical protein
MTVASLENRFGPFRSDEGSNPSPSASDLKPLQMGFFLGVRPPDIAQRGLFSGA